MSTADSARAPPRKALALSVHDHLAIAIGVNAVNARRRVRFFSAADLVNHRDAERRAGRAGDQLCRVDLVIIDELGYLPFAQAGGQLLFHLISTLDERTAILVTTNLTSPNGPPSSATPR